MDWSSVNISNGLQSTPIPPTQLMNHHIIIKLQSCMITHVPPAPGYNHKIFILDALLNIFIQIYHLALYHVGTLASLIHSCIFLFSSIMLHYVMEEQQICHCDDIAPCNSLSCQNNIPQFWHSKLRKTTEQYVAHVDLWERKLSKMNLWAFSCKTSIAWQKWKYMVIHWLLKH